MRESSLYDERISRVVLDKCAQGLVKKFKIL